MKERKVKVMQVKGVNLGNWLVLEKWMSPGLFEGTTAEDEHNLPLQLPKEVYEARMKMHRAEYITERDFTRIRSIGMDAVRIPVPYFIFGDREPFIGCIEELDKAFNWAEKYGLQILIDLHTAPGSQNGFDNGGESGVCIWSQDPDEVEFELSVLERLAQRYGTRKGLWGIEIINEPVLDKLKLNIRSLIASQAEDSKDLLDLCIDVIYHRNMKAFGLQQLVKLYEEWASTPSLHTEENAE